MQNIYKPVLTAFFALLLIVMADKAVAGGNQDVISDVVYVNSPNVIVDLSVLDDMMISNKPVKLVQPDGGKKPAQKLSSKPKAKAKAKTQAKKKAKKTSSAKPAKAKKAAPKAKQVPVSPLTEEEKKLPEPTVAAKASPSSSSVPAVAQVPVAAPAPVAEVTKATEAPAPKADTTTPVEVKPVAPLKAQTPEKPADSDNDTVLDFSPNATALNAENISKLKNLAAKLNANENIGVRIMSYARDEEAGSSKSRRQSLSRALAARSILMDEGVRSTRIEVRALGNKVQQDKIYLEIVERK